MGGVVLVGPVPPWRSGIADQSVRLARALARLGRTPVVVTFRRMYPRWLYPGAADRGPGGFPCDLGDVRPLLDGGWPPSFGSAAREIAALRPELVLVPWWTAFWAPHTTMLLGGLGKRSPGTVRLLLCHNVDDHDGSAVRRALSGPVLRRADRLAVQSRRDLESVGRRAPGVRAGLIPHPSEPRKEVPDRAAARARLGIEPEAPLFLFSGILRPYKGWDLLLQAFGSVRAAVPGARLALTGEPWGEAAALGRRTDPEPGVRLELRYLDEEERALWFAACDAVVCPYRRATGSGIAADALAHGRPVIGSAIDGLSEVIEDGVSGLLVAPGDPRALADAMVRFVRGGLGPDLSAGAERRRAAFTPEAHARAILELAGLSV